MIRHRLAAGCLPTATGIELLYLVQFITTIGQEKARRITEPEFEFLLCDG
ncbi:MAG TPA: hypothetical protein VLA84_05705 [Microcoleus sp.]|nr:hypothetical protein [Microcoleus sp.]